ncbi:ABC-2 transporter permease [Allofustis seminis]|uniref:ABC-2 transporter permease n=1 Tax=Allofustis seminis TaxID=166939 RepID=UPI00036E7FE5|nr:ABC-2 transporter permease [Allofustis seminis]
MIGIFYKDIVSSKLSYFLTVIISLVIIFYAISQHQTIFIPFLFVYLPIILTGVAFTVEEQSSNIKFILTTPISHTTYVKSKYIFTLCFSFLEYISSLVVFKDQFGNLQTPSLIGALVFSLPIIITSIQIPCILKFGAEKGRIIMVATYFGLFALSNLLSDKLEVIISKLQNIGMSYAYLVTAGICLSILMIMAISIKIGTLIVQYKEY